MLDINGGELLVLAGVALVVLGPERLPDYAAQLGRLVRDGRRFARQARAQVREEMGPEFDDVDWRKLDPRQYDPRRIVREALLDDDDEDLFGTSRSSRTSDSGPAVPRGMRASEGSSAGPATYDTDAT